MKGKNIKFASISQDVIRFTKGMSFKDVVGFHGRVINFLRICGILVDIFIDCYRDFSVDAR